MHCVLQFWLAYLRAAEIVKTFAICLSAMLRIGRGGERRAEVPPAARRSSAERGRTSVLNEGAHSFGVWNNAVDALMSHNTATPVAVFESSILIAMLHVAVTTTTMESQAAFVASAPLHY
jgi:hypothetical protein